MMLLTILLTATMPSLATWTIGLGLAVDLAALFVCGYLLARERAKQRKARLDAASVVCVISALSSVAVLVGLFAAGWGWHAFLGFLAVWLVGGALLHLLQEEKETPRRT